MIFFCNLNKSVGREVTEPFINKAMFIPVMTGVDYCPGGNSPNSFSGLRRKM